jgi:hypothetical protein
MRIPPKGVWANFTTTCVTCGGEITITNGRQEPHQCREAPITLADIRSALANR